MQQALGKTSRLDIQDFLTGGSHLLLAGNEGMRGHGAQHLEGRRLYRLTLDDLRLRIALGTDERRVGLALGAQSLHVNLGHLQLRLEGIAFPFHQNASVLENHGIAAIDHILRRLAEATGRIDVGADGTGTLLSQQRAQVLMLTQHLVTCRTVQDDVGTSHRQVIAGWHGSPHILADFHAELHAGSRLEHLRFCRHGNVGTSQIDVGIVEVLRGGEPALLIELIIIGQIGLGNNSQQVTGLDDGSTVEQQASRLYGHTDHTDDVQLTGKVKQHHQSFLRLRQQELFLKKVLTTIARDG